MRGLKPLFIAAERAWLPIERFRLRLAGKTRLARALRPRDSDLLSATLDRIAPVRMAFIDGHHQYQPTPDYFEAIAAKAAPGCVFVFDDIRWSSGMKRAWRELRRDPRFDAVADLGGMGVGVLR